MSLVHSGCTAGDRGETLLKLTHSVPLELAGSTAGALYVGPGWDGALLGLALYLGWQVSDDPVAAADSPEAQDFNVTSIEEWVEPLRPRERPTQTQLRPQQVSLAQFAPDLVRPE